MGGLKEINARVFIQGNTVCILCAVHRALNVLNFSIYIVRVSKYPPNVIFLLMPRMQKNSRKCYSIEANEGEFYTGSFVLLKCIEA